MEKTIVIPRNKVRMMASESVATAFSMMALLATEEYSKINPILMRRGRMLSVSPLREYMLSAKSLLAVLGTSYGHVIQSDIIYTDIGVDRSVTVYSPQSPDDVTLQEPVVLGYAISVRNLNKEVSPPITQIDLNYLFAGLVDAGGNDLSVVTDSFRIQPNEDGDIAFIALCPLPMLRHDMQPIIEASTTPAIEALSAAGQTAENDLRISQYTDTTKMVIAAHRLTANMRNYHDVQAVRLDVRNGADTEITIEVITPQSEAGQAIIKTLLGAALTRTSPDVLLAGL
jgi:hypothetical protein